jgi:Concanavalin A-like lectin/glucanases superfamily
VVELFVKNDIVPLLNKDHYSMKIHFNYIFIFVLLIFASCSFNTGGLDETGNNNNTNTCPNGVIDADEDCDGTNLNNQTCDTQGYYGTGLNCDSLCKFDLSVCENNGYCGNGSIETGEETCDGTNLNDQNCSTLGIGTGEVSCDNCAFNTSSCLVDEICNDNIDNDGDNDIDCADLDCHGVGLCNPENSDDLCADEFDNDGDGNVDCEDPECDGHGLCSSENSDLVCADGFDNDGDGNIDCEDPECDGYNHCTTTNSFSMDFDTSGEYIHTSPITSIVDSTSIETFTVSFWIKIGLIQGDWASPIGSATGSSWTNGFGFYLRFGQIHFWVNNFENNVTDSAILVPEVWYHITGTFNSNAGNNNIKLFINGALESSDDLTTNMVHSDFPFEIGAINNGVYDFSGNIDEVSIWNSSLDSTNVTALYNLGTPFDPTTNYNAYVQAANLKAYWKMGDNDYLPLLLDSKGSHDGTIYNHEGDEIVNDTP